MKYDVFYDFILTIELLFSARKRETQQYKVPIPRHGHRVLPKSVVPPSRNSAQFNQRRYWNGYLYLTKSDKQFLEQIGVHAVFERQVGQQTYADQCLLQIVVVPLSAFTLGVRYCQIRR